MRKVEVVNPLASSPIYPYIHQFILDLNGNRSETYNSRDVFAEVFSLCRRVATDSALGENVLSQYVYELRNRIGNKRQVELILCLTWVVLTVQEHPSYTVSAFTRQIKAHIRYCSLFAKAFQLAVTVRQHERHIKTDFLVTENSKVNMKIEIKGNPGTGNTFIENVENLNPNATTVITKHYHISSPISSTAEATIDALAEQHDEQKKKKEVTVDTTPIKNEILTWVSKIRPFLCDDWKANYMKMWDEILELQEVKENLYKPGKQQGTNFNRYLVCNIIYYLDSCGAYSEDYNASAMTKALVNDKESSLRKQLGKAPSDEIVKRLRKYFLK